MPYGFHEIPLLRLPRERLFHRPHSGDSPSRNDSGNPDLETRQFNLNSPGIYYYTGSRFTFKTDINTITLALPPRGPRFIHPTGTL